MMTIDFSTNKFQAAHGKSPCGVGSWGFVPYNKSHLDNYLDFVFWFTGSYADAKKAARLHFKTLSISNIMVCS